MAYKPWLEELLRKLNRQIRRAPIKRRKRLIKKRAKLRRQLERAR